MSLYNSLIENIITSFEFDRTLILTNFVVCLNDFSYIKCEKLKYKGIDRMMCRVAIWFVFVKTNRMIMGWRQYFMHLLFYHWGPLMFNSILFNFSILFSILAAFEKWIPSVSLHFLSLFKNSICFFFVSIRIFIHRIWRLEQFRCRSNNGSRVEWRFVFFWFVIMKTQYLL